MARTRSHALIGRTDELALLRAAADRARTGEQGLVLVTGESGIGKSRLVAEFAAELDDALVLVSHGVAMSTGEIPYAVVADLLKNLLRGEPGALTPTERQALSPLLPGRTARHPVADRALLLSAALDLLERLAEDRLVVWLVDDLQWTDAESKDLLAVAVRTVATRLLVVATVRTADPLRDTEEDRRSARLVDELARLPNADLLALGRLSEDDVRRQIVALRVDLTPSALERVVRLSGGVPFVVEELAAGGGEASLSAHVQLTRTRLDALSEDTRRLVEAAAIGTGHIRLSLLEQVTGLTADRLDGALRAATAAGLLEDAPRDEELAFRHPLVREAVDAAIGPHARREWHRRWAAVLDANTGLLARAPAAIAVARHWARVGDERRMLRSAAPAARIATDLDLYDLAAELWDTVARLWDGREAVAGLEGHTRRDVWALQRAAHSAAGDGVVPEGGADDPSTSAALELEHLGEDGTVGLARAHDTGWAAEIEARLRSGPRDLMFTRALYTLATAVHYGREPMDRALLEEVVRLDRAHGNVKGEAVARVYLAHIDLLDGDRDAAITRLEVLLAEPTSARPWVQHWGGWALLMFRQLGGDHVGAQRALDGLLPWLDRRVAPYQYAYPLGLILRSWLDTGRWEQAEEAYLEHRSAWAGEVHLADLRMAELELLRTGDVADADAWLARVEAPLAPHGPDRAAFVVLAALIQGHRGDAPAMRALLAPVWREVHPVYADQALDGTLWSAVRDVVRLEVDAAARGPDPADLAAARAHVATVAEFEGRMQHFGGLGEARRAELRAQLARLSGSDPVVELRAAVAAWDRIGHVHDAATDRVVLAEALAAAGQRDEAREVAQETVEVARDLGAAPLLGRAEGLLARLGIAGRTAGLLTRREREVLALLTRGRTNEQIASELFMSPKTASVHVSHIIAKLGVTNRTAAAAVAHSTGLIEPRPPAD